ncbi:MAG: ACT domain-containing protein, partial [Eubacteriales bacterium]
NSAVGNSMTGAKIMGRIAKFDEVLKNGDVVEVLTTKNGKGPSRDWLKICKSNQARNKIKQWFKRECREENIVQGKASFESELRRLGVPLSILNDDEIRPTILKKLAFESLDDLYAAIGYGGLTALKAVGRIKSDVTISSKISAQKDKVLPGLDLTKTASKKNDSGVMVEGIDSCMVKFARCCTPVPGDSIIGFITKGYGVSIHRTDCPNTKPATDPAQSDRWVAASWLSQAQEPFSTSLEIDSINRQGVVVDIATILATMKLRVTEISGRDLTDGRCLSHVTFEVKNIQELNTATQKIRNLSGVTEVRRGKA